MGGTIKYNIDHIMGEGGSREMGGVGAGSWLQM